MSNTQWGAFMIYCVSTYLKILKQGVKAAWQLLKDECTSHSPVWSRLHTSVCQKEFPLSWTLISFNLTAWEYQLENIRRHCFFSQGCRTIVWNMTRQVHCCTIFNLISGLWNISIPISKGQYLQRLSSWVINYDPAIMISHFTKFWSICPESDFWCQ